MSTVFGSVVIEDTLEVNGQNITEIAESALLNSNTGIINGGVLSIASSTEFNITAGSGVIVSISGANVTENKISWSAFNNQTPNNLNTTIVTHIFINGSGAIVQQNTPPTQDQFRSLIYLGRVIHQDQTTITGVANTKIPVYQMGLATIDLIKTLGGVINYEGNVFSPNGNNLSLDKSYGELFNLGRNYNTTPNNANMVALASDSPATFAYRFQDSVTLSNTTTINPAIYDLNGTSTAVPNNKYTIQRIFLFPSGNIRIQPGQTLYDTLNEAVSVINTETFVVESNNDKDAVLRAVLIVRGNASDLSDVNQARIYNADLFGTFDVGISTTTLQQAYNNSKDALLITSATQNAVKIQAGVLDTDNVLEISDTNENITFFVKGDGTSSVDALLNNKANTSHTHLASHITDLSKTSVGLGNLQNVDQTNASNITSGTLNNARLSASLSQLGGLTFTTNDFIQYNGTTLTNVTPTQVKTSIGLSNVVNSLQVINAGGGTSFASGLLSARPTASVNGRFFITTDSGPYFDNGSTWVPVQAPITGDISIGANDNIATLPTINPNVGTYNNLTVNSKGQVTAGSNANYLNDSSGNGVIVRTALNTTTARTITGTTNQISITNGDGVSGNPTIAIANNPVIPGTGSITIPTGTTAQRDTPTNGQLRYNSTLGYAEISDGNIYHPLGKIAQVITGDITQTTGTTILPYDATVPQITEGFQIWTADITPYYATSTILVMFNIFVEASGATIIPTVALFSTVTPTTTTLAASSAYTGVANTPMNIAMVKSFTSGTTNAITLSARVGPRAAATVYVNRGNSETFGGAINTSYTIMEII